nr:MAG TPA: hypothetical protein [Caudoviricetes sp.]
MTCVSLGYASLTNYYRLPLLQRGSLLHDYE